MIYVLCGSESVSGGPELAHQFCHTVNTLGKTSAEICYVDVSAPLDRCLPIDCDCPAAYTVYNTTHATDLTAMDREENLIVIPEGLTRSHIIFHKARIVLWWMSVDNYFLSTKGSNLNELREHCLLHLTQSRYAFEFCCRNFDKNRIMMLTDYINPEHGKFIYPAEFRDNIALYNPKKGYPELKPLIDKASWLKWIPLVGLGLEETILYMQNAKIYVDFGNHPGKDRIPREAAVNGCCVITNKKGSAAFHEDVPIPEEYKFEDPSVSLVEIDSLLHDICTDFKIHQDRFAEYRKWIHEEKDRFCKEVKEFLAAVSASADS